LTVNPTINYATSVPMIITNVMDTCTVHMDIWPGVRCLIMIAEQRWWTSRPVEKMFLCFPTAHYSILYRNEWKDDKIGRRAKMNWLLLSERNTCSAHKLKYKGIPFICYFALKNEAYRWLIIVGTNSRGNVHFLYNS